MRTLVISDIHGCLDEFLRLLETVKYTPNSDRLILLGDYIDRGKNSKEVLEEIMSLSKYNNVLVLRGNHDDRFFSLLNKENLKHSDLLDVFIKYGGLQTLKSYYSKTELLNVEHALQYIKDDYKAHVEFLGKLNYYHEDKNFIYVHAGLDPKYKKWKEQPLDRFLNIRQEFTSHKTNADKVVIFGHQITVNLHGNPNIWFSDDKIGIDGGCAYGYQLNCLEILEGELNQYAIKSNL